MAIIQVNDDFGSYICEYGYFHDYSKLRLNFDKNENEIIGPFISMEELIKSLDDE